MAYQWDFEETRQIFAQRGMHAGELPTLAELAREQAEQSGEELPYEDEPHKLTVGEVVRFVSLQGGVLAVAGMVFQWFPWWVSTGTILSSIVAFMAFEESFSWRLYP